MLGSQVYDEIYNQRGASVIHFQFLTRYVKIQAELTTRPKKTGKKKITFYLRHRQRCHPPKGRWGGGKCTSTMAALRKASGESQRNDVLEGFTITSAKLLSKFQNACVSSP